MPKVNGKEYPYTAKGKAAAKKAAKATGTPVKMQKNATAKKTAMQLNQEMQSKPKQKIFGGTGYAQEPFGKAVKRTTAIGQSVTRRNKKEAVSPSMKKPMFKANSSKATPIAKPKPKTTAKPKTKSKMTPEDKAYSDLLKKYGNDVTKIPGFKNGKGTI